MCMETPINLLATNDCVGMISCGTLKVNHWPRFRFRAVHLSPFLDSTVKHPTNISKFLESLVASRLPRREWELELEFRINIKRTSEKVFEMHSVEVIINSQVIENLYSLMRCGGSTPRGRLTLKLKATLFARSFGKLLYAFRIPSVDVQPQVINGKYNHGSYKSTVYNPEIAPGYKRIDLDNLTSWELNLVGLDAFITDPDCQFTLEGILSYSKKVNNDFLDNGMQPDMKIVLDNGVSIPCHRNILAAKSPVIATALESQAQDNCLETFEGEFEMLDRTKEEVMAFLSYLYQEHGTEKALEDPQMTLAILEMAHRYNVPQLEAKMTEILRNTSVERFSHEAGRALAFYAEDTPIIDDLGLEEKGWVVQKLWPEKKASKKHAGMPEDKIRDIENWMKGVQESSAPVG